MIKQFKMLFDVTSIDEAAPLGKENKCVASLSYDKESKYGESGNTFYIVINDSNALSYRDNEDNAPSALSQELKDMLENGKDNDDIVISDGKTMEVKSEKDIAYFCPLDYKSDMTDSTLYETLAKCINEYEGEEIVPSSYNDYLLIAKDNLPN